MKDDGNADLVVRTTEFALRIVRMFVALPKTEEARVTSKAAGLLKVSLPELGEKFETIE